MLSFWGGSFVRVGYCVKMINVDMERSKEVGWQPAGELDEVVLRELGSY